ncbi:MAG: hypothetical protein J6S84_09050 [Bacteroidales bacterium]|nr:hypothetical protein [Bacteroidales bacterium]
MKTEKTVAKASYLQERLKALQITDDENRLAGVTMPDDTGTPCPQWRYFTETKDGDIQINYVTPDAQVIMYDNGNKNNPLRHFFRKRYQNPPADRKYWQPPKTETIPFSTPEIVRTYLAGEETRTLYVVEGEFKAFAMSKMGLPTFGIGGIQNFRSPSKDAMHPIIIDYIKRCRVCNVVLVHDADCLKIEWKEDKDLAERPQGFYSAVNMFSEMLKPLDINLYYAHIVKESEYKGIDDLLFSGFCDRRQVVDELKALITGINSRKYILTYLITGTSSFQIKRIFGLDSAQTFYDLHADVLENREFKWKGDYYYIDETGKLTVSWRGEQENYVRIGVDYYKKVVEVHPNGQSELNLLPWTASAITLDWSKTFLKQIRKFDAFTNLPDNNPETYRQFVEGQKKGVKSLLYNRYSPVEHKPEKGQWNSINKLLHHIFDYRNTGGESLYEFALDYLQLLYTQPARHLPIIALVSKERGTGKTTFLTLLHAIFSENMRTLDSSRISSDFTDVWAGKLIVAVDESQIDTDKPIVANRLKMIATNPTIPLEAKGKSAKEVPNFSKLIMCSNDESNFMKIDIEENRYCIIKVPVIPEGECDPHMNTKMESEIPAFLYFLKNRQLYYEEKSRLYFDEKVYDTPALDKIKRRTENGLIKNLKDVIKNQFTFMHSDTVNMSLSVLYELVSYQYKYADRLKIAEYLRDSGYRTGVAKMFSYRREFDLPEILVKDRFYTFSASDWMTLEEFEELRGEIEAQPRYEPDDDDDEDDEELPFGN